MCSSDDKNEKKEDESLKKYRIKSWGEEDRQRRGHIAQPISRYLFD